MHDIFLSYSRKDKDTVRRFADALTGAGFAVWWDTEIRTGEAYDVVIETALRDARAVIVLWSASSAGSRWVRSEATLAQNRGTLLPVTIEPCDRPIMFELVHTPDLSAWRGHPDDPLWRGFVAELRDFLARDQAATPAAPSTVDIARGAAFVLPDKPSVALLPFTDLGGGAGDFLADAIVEEISTMLSQCSTLFVIAGSSSLTYRGQGQDAATICRELGVRYLLEGSVRRAGERVRVSVKLIDGIVGEQIWADKFDDTMHDVFELQDRIALAVATCIDSTIDTAELKRAIARPSSRPDANELYWRANALFRAMGKDALIEAIDLCDQALALDPGHGWAASLAAFCHASLFSTQLSDAPMDSRAKALALVDVALAASGDDMRTLGYCGAAISCAAGDPRVAKRLIDRCLELNPNSAVSLFWGGWNAVIVGDAQLALDRFEASLRCNPRSIVRPHQLTGIGVAMLFLGRHADAAAVLTEAAALAANFAPTHAALAAALAHSGRLAEAARAAERHRTLGGGMGVLFLLNDESQRDLLMSGLTRARETEPVA